jgi:hypothetical protein
VSSLPSHFLFSFIFIWVACSFCPDMLLSLHFNSLCHLPNRWVLMAFIHPSQPWLCLQFWDLLPAGYQMG